jgi:hypothetical protein
MDVGLAAFIAFNVVVAVGTVALAERWRRRLQSQVRRLGLEPVGRDTYRGVVEGLAVEVTLGGESSGMRVVVRPFTSIEYIGPHALRPFGPLVPTGDVSFDKALAACGDEAAIRGALDAAMRSAVITQGIAVRYGQLEGSFGSIPAAEAIVQVAARLHHRLHCTPDDRRVQLEENARRDPVPAVRLRCVAALARVPGGLARADAIARDASLDQSVRAQAAMVAGSSDVLAAIAAETTDADRLAEVTDGLDAHGSRELPDALRRVRAFVRDTPTPALVRILGKHGSVDDVPMLTALRDEATADLRRAARDAVSAIQRRIVGTEDGALAIAEASGGEVAIADDGGLALTRTEKGDPPS